MISANLLTIHNNRERRQKSAFFLCKHHFFHHSSKAHILRALTSLYSHTFSQMIFFLFHAFLFVVCLASSSFVRQIKHLPANKYAFRIDYKLLVFTHKPKKISKARDNNQTEYVYKNCAANCALCGKSQKEKKKSTHTPSFSWFSGKRCRHVPLFYIPFIALVYILSAIAFVF